MSARHVGERVARGARHRQRGALGIDVVAFRQVIAGFLVQIGPGAAALGFRLAGRAHVLEQPGGLRVGQVEAQQAHREADGLGVTLEVLQVAEHGAA